MHFPMYTVKAERLLEMTQVCPHEELKAGQVEVLAPKDRTLIARTCDPVL